MKKRSLLFHVEAILIGWCLVLLLVACGPSTSSTSATAHHPTPSPTPLLTPTPTPSPTPSPDSAPPDTASFSIKTTTSTFEPFSSNPTLIITGHPDGGTICSPPDNGQPVTSNGTDTDNATGQRYSYTETDTASCSGTYKSGQVTYVETLVSSSVVTQENGNTSTCTLSNSPVTNFQLTGVYTGNKTFTGTVTYTDISYSCTNNFRLHLKAGKDSWKGTLV